MLESQKRSGRVDAPMPYETPKMVQCHFSSVERVFSSWSASMRCFPCLGFLRVDVVDSFVHFKVRRNLTELAAFLQFQTQQNTLKIKYDIIQLHYLLSMCIPIYQEDNIPHLTELRCMIHRSRAAHVGWGTNLGGNGWVEVCVCVCFAINAFQVHQYDIYIYIYYIIYIYIYSLYNQLQGIQDTDDTAMPREKQRNRLSSLDCHPKVLLRTHLSDQSPSLGW